MNPTLAFLCGKLMMLKEPHCSHCLLYALAPPSQEQGGQAGVTHLSLPDNKQSISPPSEPPSTCPSVHTALKIMSFRGHRGQQLNLIKAEQHSHRKFSFWLCCLWPVCLRSEQSQIIRWRKKHGWFGSPSPRQTWCSLRVLPYNSLSSCEGRNLLTRRWVKRLMSSLLQIPALHPLAHGKETWLQRAT